MPLVNSQASGAPRPKVIDVSTSYRKNNKKRNFETKHVNSQHHINDHHSVYDNVALEMQPVIRTLQEYARRTHAIGASKGASMLLTLATRLRALNLQDQAIDDIVIDAETSAAELKQLLFVAYRDD